MHTVQWDCHPCLSWEDPARVILGFIPESRDKTVHLKWVDGIEVIHYAWIVSAKEFEGKTGVAALGFLRNNR